MNLLADCQQQMQSFMSKYVDPLCDYIFNGARINASSGQIEVTRPLRLMVQVTDLNVVS